MDPASAVTAKVLLEAIEKVTKKRLLAYPTYILEEVLHQVLELGVRLSDELDRRVPEPAEQFFPEGDAPTVP